MTIKQFLDLVGAPWTACHDHPDEDTAADLATIRPSNKLGYDSVCGVYGCTYEGETGEVQRARRDLIAAAPDLLAAIKDLLDVFVEDPLDANPSAAIHRAYRAIAKAKGEQE